MNLEGVEKTMLLTLYTKAKHSQEKNHKFFDFKAIDVISEIDYDFSLADKDHQMQWGVISRTIVLDDMVSKYIRSHPECTIVNIASGMDTRFNRLDNGIIKWYNVDLENSAKFRLNYIKDSNRVKTLAYSAMDSSWAIEGLTMYLAEEDNKRILDIIDENFKSCTVFTEIMPPVSVKNVKEKSVEEMDAKFIAEATAAGFVNLKGHRVVGGMRASIYNAMPTEGVEKLAEFILAFEQKV